MTEALKAVLARRGNRSKLFAMVFGTPEGERVLAEICRLAHIGHSTYVPDTTRMAMNEGARNLAIIIIQLAKVDPQKMAERLQQPNNDDL